MHCGRYDVAIIRDVGLAERGLCSFPRGDGSFQLPAVGSCGEMPDRTPRTHLGLSLRARGLYVTESSFTLSKVHPK